MFCFSPAILPRFHRHADKIIRVQQIIQHRESLIIIGIRFAYGLRTVGPIIIGAAKVDPLKFFILNIIGGMLWGIIIVSAGYFASAAVLALPLHTYLSWFIIIAAIITLIMLLRRKRTRHH